MRIAFYAPLKSPNHPIPSGDRLMGRLLVRALELSGHSVEIVSDFRNFAPTPEAAMALEGERQAELSRLKDKWRQEPRPHLWFCYHPYYKSPDPFGPILAAEFGISYVTAETSYSPKRNATGWAASQASVAAAIRQAAINIALTERDRAGVEQAIPDARFASIKPFIDTAPFRNVPLQPDSQRLVTVAMMRPGDKMDSYAMLAHSLRLIEDKPWTLAIVGDGPMRAQVEMLFSDFAPGRIDWLGERSPVDVPGLLGTSGVYVWPGCGEAYGLAYLEAQAAGLPVVAQRTGGVPAVIEDGVTGHLTAEGDVERFAAAIGGLLQDPERRLAIGAAARRFVLEERSLEIAAQELGRILNAYAGVGP
ncbi:glycosyltransferase family 4 protein [Rhizobium sp. P32RR-XVIII]|uniref:glycosyltransferase family 4 protein n=1 Tax=Rhizobium sp. P32RR-XVIII TaxID=2726738 RepID=UPI00145771FA|nr:glycosyltransferase family 4 protein [Rhizobium sp. P32RR-XVIII]NLS04001.1 glycosyltransferase family 4 protein [Rhizobium sp. P32RR-XVIII]